MCMGPIYTTVQLPKQQMTPTIFRALNTDVTDMYTMLSNGAGYAAQLIVLVCAGSAGSSATGSCTLAVHVLRGELL
jgi:hypothetical protein